MHGCWPRPRTKGESHRSESANKDAAQTLAEERGKTRQICQEKCYIESFCTIAIQYLTHTKIWISPSWTEWCRRDHRRAPRSTFWTKRWPPRRPTRCCVARTESSACQSSGTYGSMCNKTTYQEITTQIETFFTGFCGIQNSVVISRIAARLEEWNQMMLGKIKEKARTHHLVLSPCWRRADLRSLVSRRT